MISSQLSNMVNENVVTVVTTADAIGKIAKLNAGFLKDKPALHTLLENKSCSKKLMMSKKTAVVTAVTTADANDQMGKPNLQIDKYIGGLPDTIHGNVMSARPKTLDFAIKLANDLIYQKLRTYAERQNENKRKADDSSRNNHQQQPHKKQNVARAYTAGPCEKKAYTGDLPLCTKCNYHHTG
ncbi:hypothetical protein Tco_1320210 [Tanacetum coccineum]